MAPVIFLENRDGRVMIRVDRRSVVPRVLASAVANLLNLKGGAVVTGNGLRLRIGPERQRPCTPFIEDCCELGEGPGPTGGFSMQHDASPLLYEVNTRAWLRALGRASTLDDVADATLDRIAELGFDWVWLLGVWQTGPAGCAVSRSNSDWAEHYRAILSDLDEAVDVCGSPFAVQNYMVHRDFGGDAALQRLRTRLRDRDVRLLLDFVPNHTALDHPWVRERPEFYIQGSEADLARAPENYARVETSRGPVILAHGRDPYFPGWLDTFQWNYRHPEARAAMAETLAAIAKRCDGVRCDMAMLLLPDVIQRTWGDASLPADGAPPADASFWPDAIARVKADHPNFLFMAEVYWDLEQTLLHQGFDYAYDKKLYDRLRALDAPAVRAHFRADPKDQERLARFLENHDEERAASEFPSRVHQAAAVLTFLSPGLRLIHEGQLEGRKVHLSVHLGRRPDEPPDEPLLAFYERLLVVLRRPEARLGRWRLLDCRPAWETNPTWDRFIVFCREGPDGRRLLIAVNYGPTGGQCTIVLPLDGLNGQTHVFQDLMGPNRYERDGDDLAARGLYLDMPEWGYHVFEWATRHADGA